MRSIPGDGSPTVNPTTEVVPCKFTTEHRRYARRNIDVTVSILPVDDVGHARGQRSMGRCRNISAGGISVLCKKAIGSRFLQLDAVSLARDFSSATIEVLREIPLGDGFEIAGKFVTLPLRRMHSRNTRH